MATMKVALLAVLLLAAVILSIGTGSVHVPLWEVGKTLIGKGTAQHELILLQLRLPRAAASLLVGAAMAVSGALLQALVRNPLASPDLLGTTSGAAAAAIAFIAATNGEASIAWLPLAALAGGCAASALTYLLAWKKGSSPLRMVMIGVSVSSAMGALSIYFTLAGPLYLVSQALGWMAGTVYGTSWKHVAYLAPWVLVGTLVAMAQARSLNVLELGDPLATGVGVKVERKRFLFIAWSVALASSAVGIAGGISFVGLMAPHMARTLVGSNNRFVLPASAILGAFLVLLADLAGRTLFMPLDIPAGLFTALLGAPFFMYLLLKSKA
ncbi:iron ABC transporter permease [Paenibacillus albicereus]|uniref:Iron ABC transporter permease n=2 Tax=Paenibacillus albicereus TaxID=2726185 RepID=A0A6H2H382_9BACL|nr:iron ABC transporter permease [Paenibacillus albicereus]